MATQRTRSTGGRRRALAALAVGALTALGVAGCASAVDGEGTVGGTAARTGFPTQPTRSASAAPSTSPHPTVFPSSLPVSVSSSSAPSRSASAAPADLVTLLSPRPSGARPWSDTWGQVVRPTTSQFVKRFYAAGSRADVLTSLREEGLDAIAHRTWIARDANQIDLILMRFDTRAGALNRYLAVTSATGGRSDVARFDIGNRGRGEAQGFRESGQDSDGYVRARAYGLPAGGTVVLEAFFFSPGKFDRTELVSWTDAQLGRLG